MFSFAQRKQVLNSSVNRKSNNLNSTMSNDTIKNTKSTSGKFKRATIDSYQVFTI